MHMLEMDSDSYACMPFIHWGISSPSVFFNCSFYPSCLFLIVGSCSSAFAYLDTEYAHFHDFSPLMARVMLFYFLSTYWTWQMSSEVTKVGKQERFYLRNISIKIIIVHLVIYTKKHLLSTYYMAGLAEFGTKWMPIHLAQMNEQRKEVTISLMMNSKFMHITWFYSYPGRELSGGSVLLLPHRNDAREQSTSHPKQGTGNCCRVDPRVRRTGAMGRMLITVGQ